MSLVGMFDPTPPIPVKYPVISGGGSSGGAGGKKNRQQEIEEQYKRLQIEDDEILNIIKMFLQCQG